MTITVSRDYKYKARDYKCIVTTIFVSELLYNYC